jgi:cellobiose phosphorylase
MANLGEHGFPLMLSSDWNDMLYKVCRKGKGESIWTSMQFGTVLPMMAEMASLKGEDGQKYLDIYEAQKKLDEMLTDTDFDNLGEVDDKSKLIRDNCVLVPITLNIFNAEATINEMVTLFNK